MLGYKSSPRAGKHTPAFPNKLNTNIHGLSGLTLQNYITFQEIIFFICFAFWFLPSSNLVDFLSTKIFEQFCVLFFILVFLDEFYLVLYESPLDLKVGQNP